MADPRLDSSVPLPARGAAGSSATRVEIHFLSGARSGERLELSTEAFSVGGNPTCEVFLDPSRDPAAGGSWALVGYQDDGWQIRNLAGTEWLVNQEPLSSVLPLRSGDVIRVSPSGPDLRFLLHSRNDFLSPMPAGAPVAVPGVVQAATASRPAEPPPTPVVSGVNGGVPWLAVAALMLASAAISSLLTVWMLRGPAGGNGVGERPPVGPLVRQEAAAPAAKEQAPAPSKSEMEIVAVPLPPETRLTLPAANTRSGKQAEIPPRDPTRAAPAAPPSAVSPLVVIAARIARSGEAAERVPLELFGVGCGIECRGRQMVLTSGGVASRLGAVRAQLAASGVSVETFALVADGKGQPVQMIELARGDQPILVRVKFYQSIRALKSAGFQHHDLGLFLARGKLPYTAPLARQAEVEQVGPGAVLVCAADLSAQVRSAAAGVFEEQEQPAEIRGETAAKLGQWLRAKPTSVVLKERIAFPGTEPGPDLLEMEQPAAQFPEGAPVLDQQGRIVAVCSTSGRLAGPQNDRLKAVLVTAETIESLWDRASPSWGCPTIQAGARPAPAAPKTPRSKTQGF